MPGMLHPHLGVGGLTDGFKESEDFLLGKKKKKNCGGLQDVKALDTQNIPWLQWNRQQTL